MLLDIKRTWAKKNPNTVQYAHSSSLTLDNGGTQNNNWTFAVPYSVKGSVRLSFIVSSQLGKLTVNALETPCHTTGHICYYVHSEDLQSKAVFTGNDCVVRQ